MTLFLVGEHHGKRLVHRAAGFPLRVGRDQSSDLVLPSHTVSRHHATIEEDGEGFRVVDLGSRNGTRLNGRPVTAAPVSARVGDRIEFGSVSLQLVDREPVAAPLYADEAQLSQSLYLSREDTGSAELRYAAEPKILRLLSEVGQFLVLPGDPEETFDRILELVNRAIPAARILLLLCDESGTPVQRAARARGGRAVSPILLSGTMLRSVLQEGASLLTSDAQSDERFRDHQSVVLQNIRSAMAVPLLHNQETLGVLYADSAEAGRSYVEQDLRVFTLLGQMLGAKIANARLLEASRERERLRHEIETARTIQHRLLPQCPPAVPGYEILAWQESCDEVGGDLYDYGILPDGRVQLVLGDVSGKGVGAALLMSAVLGTIRALRGEIPSTSRLVSQLDRHLLQTTEPMHYATLFLAALDPAAGLLEYVNGGHPAALMVAADGAITELSTTDVPVGLVDRPGAVFETASVDFPRGATLLVVSDGVTEAGRADEDRFFGDGPLAAALKGCAGKSAADTVACIQRGIEEFVGDAPRADDATVLVVRRA